MILRRKSLNYAYGMRLRGYSINCQPKIGLVKVLEDMSKRFYNILIYNRRLSEEEIKNYELTYIGKIEK